MLCNDTKSVPLLLILNLPVTVFCSYVVLLFVNLAIQGVRARGIQKYMLLF